MNSSETNKRKIYNDPVYGFISIPNALVFDLIENPYFQRLRRINQLGLTHLVYPGAVHTRFQHSMGAMFLIEHALRTLSEKGIEISPEEYTAASIAILLHDLGHGPYSHTLEGILISDITHEEITNYLLEILNKEYHGKLELAISIFRNTYKRRFFHQLVSSQLDMDRLDYLRRDSFYTGVSEGVIGTERLIKMLNVANDQIVVEEKGIYSVEKFLVARRIMYWQVYLHKTVLVAEHLLIQILKRVKHITENGMDLFASPALAFFLTEKPNKADFYSNPNVLKYFSQLDDFDVMGAIKVWRNHLDTTLSLLSKMLIDRHLPKIHIQKEKFSEIELEKIRLSVVKGFGISYEESKHFVVSGTLSNQAYNQDHNEIFIASKNGALTDIASASDNFNIRSISEPVKKYFLFYPKGIKF
ncbi:MAG: HD domain-containing protein [Bacteroidales bacterium]|nr:HD domain-containing protein [Bacteroidales bacterium]